MAHLRCDFFSDSLSLNTSMTVLLAEHPTPRRGVIGSLAEGSPVLYLLHGLSDDDTNWLRFTSIERYAAERGVAVVLPQVHRSFYTDEFYGGRYWTFLSEELPDVVRGMFRLSDRREDTFVAGLSMGGYGAFTWALRQPDRFAAAACLSGAVHLSGLRSGRTRPDDPRMFERVFDDRPVDGGADDLFALLDAADPTALPALHLSCGTEDVLIEDNRSFAAAAATAGVPLTTDFGPGAHAWDYWDRQIQTVLAWMPVQDSVPGG